MIILDLKSADSLPGGVLEAVHLGAVTNQRHRELPDEGDDLHVVGGLLGQKVGLVLERRPEDLRHEDSDGLDGDVELLGDVGVEGVHELEGSSHLVGGHDVLVVEVGLLVEEAHDGHLGSLHVAGHA